MSNESVGKQILDNWGKSEFPECREVTNESWWKTFHPKLKSILEGYNGNKDKFYVMLNMRNEGLLGFNAKHATWLIFEENPPPKQMAVLWSCIKSTGELRIEWCLPDESSIEEICAMPESYDKKLVDDCLNYTKTQKIPINASKAKRPSTKIIHL